jgi:lipoprotein-releasing system permease protein
VIGVILGVAVLIIVISVMSGFDKELRDKLLGFNAHLKIFKVDTTLRDYRQVMDFVASNENVKGVAPYVLGRVLVQTQPDSGSPQVEAPYVRGLDPQWETNVSVLPASVRIGEFDVSGDSVLVGIELAHVLKLHLGDKLLVYSPRHLPRNLADLERNRAKEKETAVLPDEYTVRGIFDVGYYEYNLSVIATSLENAQELYRLRDSVHGLMVMLKNPLQAHTVSNQLQRALGFDYQISTWTDDNSGLLNALLVEKNVMFYLLFFIMIVAAFGIMNSQITFVVQKTREIGTLKALGATHGQMLWLFLSQSLVVGVLGVTAGFGLGMLALAYRNEFLHFMNRLTGIELFPASIYAFTELPSLIDPRDIAVICGSALVICVLAGLVPALNASRLKPVEALRHE